LVSSLVRRTGIKEPYGGILDVLICGRKRRVTGASPRKNELTFGFSMFIRHCNDNPWKIQRISINVYVMAEKKKREDIYKGFEQGPIRPPSEAYSLLLRLTRNCPWNRCSFCRVYKTKNFL